MYLMLIFQILSFIYIKTLHLICCLNSGSRAGIFSFNTKAKKIILDEMVDRMQTQFIFRKKNRWYTKETKQ